MMDMMIEHMIIFTLAFLIDLIIGDPPEGADKYYPIVWISRLMYFFDRRTKRSDHLEERILGIIYTVIIIVIFSVPCLLFNMIQSDIMRVIVEAVVFKMTFTVKGIERFSLAVLRAEDEEERRKAVQKIVSRDVSSLDDAHLNSATIESAAENFTDSVVSPLSYFVAFSALGIGVFGAMIYRVINTLDAVVGYKTERYEHFGWFAARADDLFNFFPERIAAFFIMLAGRLMSHADAAHQAVIQDAKSPPSYSTRRAEPLTIQAMSNVLRVRLEKAGHYIVGCEYEFPARIHIEEAVKIVKIASSAFASVCIISLMICSFFHS